jgi:glycosidase
MRLKKTLATLVATALAVSIGVGVSPATAPATAASSLAAPSWMSNATVYEVNVRQYSQAGSFNAVAADLTRIKNLGVKVIWFMPIYPISVTKRKGTLGSYYSVGNYTAVNPEFGTAADFKALVDKAHGMGFKIVLDWVANHTGWDNPWITAHPDWYTKGSNGAITQPPGTDWYDVADLNYSNTAMRTAMIDSMKYWVNTYDIDGFRCDAAGMVPNDFWHQASVALEAIKPLWMLAEAAPGDVSMGTDFSSAYNWDLLGTENGLKSNSGSKYDFNGQISNIQANYPAGTFAMNFITNHDENSWNGTEYTRLGSVGAVKAASVLYFTLPGAPLIYNGQEVGMNKQLAFFEKDQIPWVASPMTAFYTKLVSLKSTNAALAVGSAAGAIRVVTTNKDGVMAYVRSSGKSKVLVAINLTNKSQKVTLSWGASAGKLYDYASNKLVSIPASQTVTLPAWGYQVDTTNQLKN